MKIFVDFDDVIFNTKRFRQDLLKIFLKNGISEKEFKRTYDLFSKAPGLPGAGYHPKKQLKFLKNRKEINIKKIERQIDAFLRNLKKYLFSDSRFFMVSFPRRELYLISYGNIGFQRTKIRESGAAKFFKRVIVSKRNKLAIISKMAAKKEIRRDEEVVLIDDRPENLKKAAKMKVNVATFRMRRKEGRYSSMPSGKVDFNVKNLREAIRIIKKKKARNGK